jgi:hypothetical protein
MGAICHHRLNSSTWLFDVLLHVTDPLLANVARTDEPQDLDAVGHPRRNIADQHRARGVVADPANCLQRVLVLHDAERRGGPGDLRLSDGADDSRCLPPAAAAPRLRTVAPRSIEPVPSARLPNGLTIRQLPGPSSPIGTPKFLRSPRASKIGVAVETVTSRSFVGGVGPPAIRRLVT